MDPAVQFACRWCSEGQLLVSRTRASVGQFRVLLHTIPEFEQEEAEVAEINKKREEIGAYLCGLCVLLFRQ